MTENSAWIVIQAREHPHTYQPGYGKSCNTPSDVIRSTSGLLDFRTGLGKNRLISFLKNM